MSQILNTDRLSKRADSLRLTAISLAEDIRQGSFKSLYRGQGIEFSDVREYQPFDNVRAIDWNVTARMGRTFIKQYEEDKELSILLIVDCSRSMETAFQNNSKLSSAIESAALLLLAGEHNQSSIGAVFFDGKILFSCEAKSGRKNAMVILSKLDKIEKRSEEEKSDGSVLPNALKGALKILKKRSLVFVISDFRTVNWEKPFAHLSQKHDVISIKITDNSDYELPKIGTVPFYDAETKKLSIFPTFSKRFKSQWLRENLQKTDQWKEFCLKHGANPVLLDTSEDCALVLSRFFAQKRR
ncbi:DUF58 domain-containing protein [Treponema sp.]|uniref:DUF58 domain-containing protein n=1 Tax=Treponema sp. TaxID=166 RepID=UPI00388EF50D